MEIGDHCYICRRRALLSVAVVGIGFVLVGRSAAAAVAFELSAHDGANQSFAVTMRLTHLDADVIEVRMPVWTPGYPGYYQLIDYDTYLGYGGLKLELKRDGEGEARLTPLPQMSPAQAAIFASWLGENGGGG